MSFSNLAKVTQLRRGGARWGLMQSEVRVHPLICAKVFGLDSTGNTCLPTLLPVSSALFCAVKSFPTKGHQLFQKFFFPLTVSH